MEKIVCKNCSGARLKIIKFIFQTFSFFVKAVCKELFTWFLFVTKFKRYIQIVSRFLVDYSKRNGLALLKVITIRHTTQFTIITNQL